MRRPSRLATIVAVGVVCLGVAATALIATHSSSSTPAAANMPSDDSGVGGAGGILGQSAGQHIPVAGHPPVGGHAWYLVVGDSISFGYTVDPARGGKNSSWPLLLQPLLAARGQSWDLYDVACPGETTTSYASHCRDSNYVPFLANQSQRDAALGAARAHRADLRLILVDLGSNDLLRGLAAGVTPADLAARLRTNLTTIVSDLERVAPDAAVVIANYYNPLQNTAPGTEAELSLINDLVAQVASATHARLADFHAAINSPSTPDPELGRYVDSAHHDVHPTIAGQQRLARAALSVIPG